MGKYQHKNRVKYVDSKQSKKEQKYSKGYKQTTSRPKIEHKQSKNRVINMQIDKSRAKRGKHTAKGTNRAKYTQNRAQIEKNRVTNRLKVDERQSANRAINMQIDQSRAKRSKNGAMGTNRAKAYPKQSTNRVINRIKVDQRQSKNRVINRVKIDQIQATNRAKMDINRVKQTKNRVKMGKNRAKIAVLRIVSEWCKNRLKVEKQGATIEQKIEL